MADITPLTVFSSAGERSTDGLTQTNGFPASQKPKRQWFNWLFNSMTAKINETVERSNWLTLRESQMQGQLNQTMQRVYLLELERTAWHLPINSIVEIDEALTTAQFAQRMGYGTWIVHGAGRVIVGAGTNTDARGEEIIFEVGEFSGEYRHVQTHDEMHPHAHNSGGVYNKFVGRASEAAEAGEISDQNGDGLNPTVQSTDSNNANAFELQISDISNQQWLAMNERQRGGGEPFNIMQPYTVASRFKRTA